MLGKVFALTSEMGRKNFFQSTQNPYHINARVHNRDIFVAPLDEAWEILCDKITFTKRAFDLRITSFLMMPNHYHLIVQAPQPNLSEAMRWFMTETSRDLNSRNNTINQNWGARFHRTEITNEIYFKNVFKYLYTNPIRARLCEKVERYKYSTLPGILGLDRLLVPVEDKLLGDDTFQTLHWLNQKSSDLDDECMRLALKKTVFKLPHINSKKCRLETNLM